MWVNAKKKRELVLLWISLLFKGHYLIVFQPLGLPLLLGFSPPFHIQPTTNFKQKELNLAHQGLNP